MSARKIQVAVHRAVQSTALVAFSASALAASPLVCKIEGSEAVSSTTISVDELKNRELETVLAKAGDVGTQRYKHKTGKALIAVSDGATCDVKLKQPEPPKAAEEAAEEDKNKEFKVNFVVPASPAFDLLGLNPSAVSTPSSPRDLAIALADGRDKDGRLKSGIAIDIAPFQWYAKSNNKGKLPEKEENGWDSDFTRIKISLATAQGRETADQSLKMAAGLSWTFFDATNKERKAAQRSCVAENIVEQKAPASAFNVFQTRTLAEVASAQRIDARNATAWALQKKLCEAKFEKLSWSERKAAFGVGRAWFSETGKLSDRTPSSSGVWLSYSQNIGYFENLEKSLQFATIARRARGETVIDPAPAAGTTAKPLKQDADTYGVRLRFGQKNGTVSIEQSQTRQQMEGRLKETVKRTAVGFDWHVYGDVWIVASGGSVSGRLYGENKPFVLTSIRYGGEKGE